jgi:hypothetical protein
MNTKLIKVNYKLTKNRLRFIENELEMNYEFNSKLINNKLKLN